MRVKWINELVDANGNFLPHLLRRRPDAALGQSARRAGRRPTRTARTGRRTRGPVPIVTHLHGAHTTEESDGYPEAWYLPAPATSRPGYASRAARTISSSSRSPRRRSARRGRPAAAVFQYPNDQRADDPVVPRPHARHDAGSTSTPGRPASTCCAADRTTRCRRRCRGPRPQLGDQPGTKLLRDPDRDPGPLLQRRRLALLPRQPRLLRRAQRAGHPPVPRRAGAADPVQPRRGLDGRRATSRRIWNPEFFGNTMVVNGKTWPYLDVEQRRYRFRLLNGCNSRFLILKLEQRPAASGRSAARAASCPARASSSSC